MSYLKIFLILIAVSINSYAKDGPAPKVDLKFEQDLVVAQAKAKQVEKQLLEQNEMLKACKETSPNNLEKCFKDEIAKFDETQLEEASKSMDLPSYDTEASKSSDNIREYLNDRIEVALRGKKKGKKINEVSLKELKFVDHAYYAKIYRSQIGKNILMEVSNYCLTNLGLKSDKEAIVNHCMNSSEANYESCKSKTDLAKAKLKKGPDNKYNGEYSPSLTVSGKEFWSSEVYEYRVCDKLENGTSDNCVSDGKKGSASTKSRSTELITALKEAEFKLGGEYLKDKINFCTTQVVSKMCEKYRCQHVYDTDLKETDMNYKKCVDIGMTPQAAPGSTAPIYNDPSKKIDISGIKACGLVSRLKEYKRVITALGEIDKFNKANKGKARGLTVSDSKAFSGTYRGGKGDEKSVEDITTISSKEFADVNFNEGMDVEQLQKDCIVDGKFDKEGKDCAQLTASEIGDAEDISDEMSAETAVYLQKVDDLFTKNADDDETINEYLTKHGLERYIGKLGPEQLKSLISDQYKSERAALKNSMMEKFNKLTKKKKLADGSMQEDTSADLVKVAEDTLVNIKNQKDRIETMVQYNNIITSYMSAKLGDGDDAKETSLSYQRDIEMEHFKDKASDDEKQRVKDYDGYFEVNDDNSSNTDNKSLTVDLGFIDTLLGNTD